MFYGGGGGQAWGADLVWGTDDSPAAVDSAPFCSPVDSFKQDHGMTGCGYYVFCCCFLNIVN